MRTALLAAAFAASLLAAPAPADARLGDGSLQAVRGPLLPTDADSDALGKFRMFVLERGRAHREVLHVDAWGLDAIGEDEAYHVFLVDAAGTTEADFGAARFAPRGRARLRFRSSLDRFPEGVETLIDFEGGKVQVRLGERTILEGEIPEFVSIGDDNDPGSGAAAREWETSRLHATEDGGRAKGFVQAIAVNRPRGEGEALVVSCWNLLARPGSEMGVVCVDREGTETRLGTFTVRSRGRIGVLHLSTRRGDTIPGGGVPALGGQTVEVRDRDGTVHLTGTFPDLGDDE